MRFALSCLCIVLIAAPAICYRYNPYTSSTNNGVCDTKKLLKHLLSDYCTYVRPNDGIGPVTIGHRMELLRFNSYDWEPDLLEDRTRVLNLDFFEDWEWRDERLAWNTSKCDKEYLVLPVEKIWSPDIAFARSSLSEPTRDKIGRNNAIIDSTGLVRFNLAHQVQIHCDPPEGYGSPEICAAGGINCTIPTGSWSYTDEDINFEITAPGGSGFSMKVFEGSADPEWFVSGSSSEVVSELFDCCPWKFRTIVYTVHLTPRHFCAK